SSDASSYKRSARRFLRDPGGRRRRAVGRAAALRWRQVAAAGTLLALLDDVQEQVLQRRRRMADRLHRPAVFLQYLFEAALQAIAQLHALRPQLEPRRVLKQRIDAAVLLKLAVVQNGNAVANVLHIIKAVAAHEYGFALLAQVDDEVLHPARAQRVQAR